MTTHCLKVSVFALLAFSAASLTSTYGDQPQSLPADTAITVRIGGVGIGSTLDEFLERLPSAVPGSAPNAIPMRDDHFVVINNGAHEVPTAHVHFLDEAVLTIEIHYPVAAVDAIAAEAPMAEQFIKRFGVPKKDWRNDALDGGVHIYTWSSDRLFVSLVMHDDGTARLYTSATDSPVLYPPKEPQTPLLGIDPISPAADRG